MEISLLALRRFTFIQLIENAKIIVSYLPAGTIEEFFSVTNQ